MFATLWTNTTQALFQKSVEYIYKRGLSEISEPEKNEVEEAVNAAIDNIPERWFLMADLWDYVEAAS